MKRRDLIKLMSRAALGAGATSLFPNCATTGGMASSGPLPPATKDNPFVNSLGMEFVPVPGTKILMCTTETTVDQYKAMGRGYQYPMFSQSGNHPAVDISWNEAGTWCEWLSQKEGRNYRLPKNVEWSMAVGGSTYPWGNQWPPPKNVGNYSGQELRAMSREQRVIFHDGGDLRIGQYPILKKYSDNHYYTAPTKSYPPNHLGLYDLGGNVWEFCLEKDPKVPNQRIEHRIVRGGGWKWGGWKEHLESSRQNCSWDGAPDIGFRCVLEG